MQKALFKKGSEVTVTKTVTNYNYFCHYCPMLEIDSMK